MTAEEKEEDDSVFPLPDIGSKTKRTLSRDTSKTSSVKDLTRNFDQIVSNQAEESKKMQNSREVARGRRWAQNAAGGDSLARQPSRSSTTSEDFFSYRPLDDRGKRWILAGKATFRSIRSRISKDSIVNEYSCLF